MLRDSDVPQIMTRVQTALVRSERGGGQAGEPLVVDAEGDAEFPLAKLRSRAEIDLELMSGSARPVIGPVIRISKRVLRRGLRWYLVPIMEQQIRFNHTVLDLVEKLRLQNERLRSELDSLLDGQDPSPPGTGR